MSTVTAAPRYVPKAWGHEEILVATEHYTLKRLVLLPGFRGSLHYHREKDETFLVESGRMRLELRRVTESGEPTGEGPAFWYYGNGGGAGDVIRIKPYMAHRFQADGRVSCVLLEISTEDRPEDTYRIEESGPIPYP